MPELAEVEFYRKQWNPGLGETVLKVRTHPSARIFRQAPADRVRKALTGKRLVDSRAHGKKLCFLFSGDVHLGLHLGMAGRLMSAHPEMIPDRHDHLVVVMRNVALVFNDYRMFGKLELHQGTTPPAWWSDLPPQPQDRAFNRKHFQDILDQYPSKSLKALLLDQDRFPGIGNWMADEILWRARIHPETRPRDLSPYKKRKLFPVIKEVCHDALETIGATWDNPPDSWLFNHRWGRNGKCPVSGKPLQWITVGGRTTCFSPAIQKEKC